MAITNRIVTRGFGKSRGLAGRAGLVTQGYGGPPRFVVEAFRRGVKGQSGRKRALRDYEEVIIWAKLVSVNDTPPPTKVQGFVRARVSKSRSFALVVAEHVSTRVRQALEDIKVVIKRLK